MSIKVRWSFLILFNFIFFSFFSQSTCGQFIDQSHPNQNAATYGGNQYQSFRAGFTGKLTQIDLYKNACENFSFTLKIYSGTSNTGGLLYTNTYSFNICSQVFSILIPYSSAPSVIANNFYTFELTVISSSSGSPMQFLNTTGNTYANGSYYSGVYGAQSNWDLYFNTYITANPNPVPTIQSVTNCSCFGQANGSITTQVTGGTSPFIYSWSPGGANTANLTNAVAGNYTFTVNDVNGCSGSVSGTISQPSPVSSTFSNNTPVGCFGGNNGSVSVSAAGGIPPYSYSWSPTPGSGSTTSNPTSMSAGTYTNVVTDGAGCTATNTVIISQPSAITTTFSNNTSVSCNGGNNGSVSVSAVGGTLPYTYSWSPVPGSGSTTSNPSSMSAGTYTNIITDGAGCTATNTVIISQPTPLTVGVFNITNVSCNGAADGSIGVAPGGGNSGYTYNWSPAPGSGQGTNVVSGLAPGTYTVVLTDSKSCTATTTGTVIQPSALSGFFPSSVNVSCTGFSDGSATFQATGGTPSYNYNWSPLPASGQGTASVSGLSAGNYTVVVTDTNSCTYSATVFINQPAGTLVASMTSYVNVACFGDASGSAGVTVGGGTSPYSYTWSPSPGTGQGTSNVGGLLAGSYTVTVTDLNNCLATAPVTISQPGQLTTSIIKSDVTCNGLSTGASTVTVSGGNGGYVFNWTPTPGSGQGSNVVGGMAAGIYTVSVTDINGCIKTDTVSINQPTPLVAIVDTFSNVSCNNFNDGIIVLSISGGTSSYSTNWNPSPGAGQSTGVASQLTAGPYIATVTDENGCVLTTDTIIISQPSSITINTDSITNVSCTLGNDGAASLIVSGGTPPFSYSWSPTPGTGQGTATAGGLSAGTYTINVSDANSCSSIYTVFINQPAGTLVASMTSYVNVACFGDASGSAGVTVGGGTSPYSYTWSPTPGTGQGTSNVGGLLAGSYTVTVTDLNNCLATAPVTISQPGQLTTSIIKSDVTCNGISTGASTVTVSGGNGGYVFNWTPAPGSGQGSNVVGGMAAGIYTVSVTDINGCVKADTVSINEPLLLNLSVNSFSNVSCNNFNDGSASISVSGGTSPYSINWSPSPGSGQGTLFASQFSAGTYVATVTDNNNCVKSDTLLISQPQALSTSVGSFTNVSCNGGGDGTASLIVSGGSTPYTYVWTPTPGSGQGTDNASGLSVGTYTVDVVDANNCSAVQIVNITQPTAIASTFSSTNVSCFGLLDGGIDLSVSGGTGPYTFSWTNGALTEDLTGVASGVYTVTITDANLCSSINSGFVGSNAQLVSSFATNSPTCFGYGDGAVNLSVTGGSPPYIYSWSNGSLSEDLFNVGAGTYIVTVSDTNSCQIIDTVNLSQPNFIVNSINVTPSSCSGGNNGAMNLFVSGATPPFIFNWSTGDTTQNISNLFAGTYTVVITDANGCTATNIDSVTQPPPLGGSLSIVDVACFGDSSGALYSFASGGVPPYTYSWNTGATTQDLINIPVGNYTWTVTDSNNCTSSLSSPINQPATLVGDSILSTGIECFGASTGSVDLTVFGGTPPYVYIWSNSAITEDISGLAAGTYSVTIYDNKGCMLTDSVIVSQPASPILASVNIQASDTVICSGTSVQFIVSSINGGLSPSYQWLLNGLPLSGANSDTLVIGSLTNGDTISAMMTSSEFCISGSVYYSNPISITVNSNPIISSENLNQQTVCFGDTLNPIDIVSLGIGLSYQWFSNSIPVNSGGILLSGEINPLLSPSSASVGSNYYYCIVSSFCGSDTSSISGAQVVLPTAPGSASITSSSNVICSGDTVVFTSSTLNVGANPVYQWLLNGLSVSGANSSSFSTSQLNNSDSISLLITSSSDACPAGINYNSNAITIIVNATPVLVSANSGPYCETDSIFLTASGSGSFSWTGPAGFSSLSQNPVIGSSTVANSGMYIVSVNQNGCNAIDTTFVSVGSKPVLSVSGNQPLTCTVNNVALSANSSGSGLVYSWVGSGIVSGSSTANVVVNSAGDYTVTATDPSTGCFDTAIVNVIQLSLSPDITTDTTQYLSCSVNILTISGGSSVPGVSYLWSPGGSNPTSASTQVNSPGNYTLTVTDPVSGCSNSGVVQVISTANIPSVYVGPNSSITCSSPTALIIGGSTDADVILSWSNGLGTPSSDTFLVNLPGTYILTVTDTTSGCSITASVTVTDESSNCDDIRFYTGMTPNNDGVNDIFQLVNIENFPVNKFYVYNRYGMIVWEGNNYDNSTIVFRGLDSNNIELLSGTYYFILEYEGKEIKGWFELIR